jgi:hypothetical protein
VSPWALPSAAVAAAAGGWNSCDCGWHNNRANNFSEPHFNQNLNQPQFRNENARNLAQQRPGQSIGQQRPGQQPNFNQPNRVGQAHKRPNFKHG